MGGTAWVLVPYGRRSMLLEWHGWRSMLLVWNGWCSTGAGMVWVRDECRHSMRAGTVPVLAQYRCWHSMGAGTVWVLAQYACWHGMDVTVWVLAWCQPPRASYGRVSLIMECPQHPQHHTWPCFTPAPCMIDSRVFSVVMSSCMFTLPVWSALSTSSTMHLRGPPQVKPLFASYTPPDPPSSCLHSS